MSLEDSLASHFPRLDRDRGRHYFDDGRVELSEIEERRFEAKVRCSREFKVTVSWADNGDDPELACTCPFARASGRCKHIWAAILAASAASPDLGGGDSDAQRPESTGDTALYDPEVPLLFVVVPSPGHPERSGSIEFFQPTAAIDERSAEVKPVRVKREQLRDVSEEFDRSLLDRLFGIPGSESGIPLPRPDRESAAHRIECSSFPFSSERAHEFAELLAGTQRLYAYDADAGRAKRLHWDGDRTYIFGVRIADDRFSGEYRVTGFIDDGSDRLALRTVTALSSAGLAVVDDHISPFDPRGSFDQIGKSVTSEGPAHSEEDLGGIVTRWVEDVCEPLVELPKDWSIDDEKTVPRPVLVFRQSDLDTYRAEGVNVRVLHDYDGRRIAAATGGTLLCKPDEYRVIRRDLDAEQKFWERLRALDLVTLDTGQYTHRVEQRSFSNVIERLVGEDWLVEARERPVSAGGEVDLKLNTLGEEGFALAGVLRFGAYEIDVAEVFAAVQRGDRFVELPDGRAGVIPASWLRRLRILQSLSRRVEGEVRFRTSQGWMLDALIGDDPEVELDGGFEIVRKRLEDFRGVQPLEEPDDFGGELREYQRDALGWLAFLREFGLGGCLADDMGLGKTVQVLAHLDRQKNLGELQGPVLVVCPNSVVYNWLEEAKRFVPNMRAVAYSGSGRNKVRETFGEQDIIVTTYGVMRRDVSKLAEHEFDTLVLDEAQAIKNSSSQTAKAARQLAGRHRLALSGTPIENRLLDLWSIFEYLNPGMLGSSTALKRLIGRKSAASTIGEETREFLARALRPFLLRRTKGQVAKELPEKTELTLYCEMDTAQRKIYRDLAKHYRSTLLRQVEETGVQTSRMHVLEALLRLRQAACHPALVDSAHSEIASCKLESLVPQIEEIRAEGHKALVFSQFTTFLKIVRDAFDKSEIPYEYLDGQTRDRQARVDRFQNDPECSIFLISLKAGGLGLNLTAAEYVYILDPWWNPAVEAQAIDRAHRIGQTRKVFAYRLICKDTVEERILDLQRSKRELADAIVRADSGVLSDLSRDDLEQLLS